MSDGDKHTPERKKPRTSVHVLVLINVFNWRPDMPTKEPPAPSMSKRNKAKVRRGRRVK
jgi:hypothetical protein